MTPAQLADLGRAVDVLAIAVRSAGGRSAQERAELVGRLREALTIYQSCGGGGRVGEAAGEVLKGEG